LRNIREVETANKLSRVLMTNLLTSIKEETSKIKPSINQENPTWTNIIHSTFLVEEMVFGSSQKQFNAS